MNNLAGAPAIPQINGDEVREELSRQELARDVSVYENPAHSEVPPSCEVPVTKAEKVEPETPPLWKDYLLLTKPRVISLLLWTTLTAMIIAQGGWPNALVMVATAVGFYMAAGAAHVINNIIDRDIDGKMPRTANRPLVAGRIPVVHAALYAAALTIGSMLILTFGATFMAAVMALSGLLFYVVVYTLVLKRRTWQNIVIGGAAGAFPPLVGWAAVTGDVTSAGSLLGWILFGIIFLWTPVHFWALAILIKDDYAIAKVPMLPVVKGDRATAVQIGGYAIVTAAATLVPHFMGLTGVTYLASAVVLNGWQLWMSYQLWREPVRSRASSLFHFSMLYLALLFLMMAIDRALIL